MRRSPICFQWAEYLAFNVDPIAVSDGAAQANPIILEGLSIQPVGVIQFVLFSCIVTGVEGTRSTEPNLPELVELKYQSIADA